MKKAKREAAYDYEVDPDLVIQKTDPCISCGCTDERACAGGCYWYEPGICSTCAIKQGLLKISNRTAKNG